MTFPISGVKRVEGVARAVPCALCGAEHTRRLYTKYGWGIERCRRCTLVYANPRAPESAVLERYSAEYFWNEYLPAAGAPGGRIDDQAMDARHRPMLELIGAAGPSGRRLLEVGSGAGLFLRAASRAGWDTAGVELSPDGAGFARERLGLDVRTESAEAMTFEAGTFDIAVMFDVVEHLFDPRAVLTATRLALKPGGLLVITTPNFDALSRYALGLGWAALNPFEHMYYFTEKTLTSMLEICGYREARRVRTFPAWGAIETMNYRYTHSPRSWRASMYERGVSLLSPAGVRFVQSRGGADALLVLARVR